MEQGINDLEKYFRSNNDRLIHKWDHYFEIYDRHFKRFRNKEIVILEIGVAQGGSLQMWKHYFGEKAKIFGVDIEPKCKEFEEDNIQIFIGSQSDRKFLKELKESVPPIDILIDDGGHTMIQQKVSFKELFNHIKEDGVYLCEDLHSSYWSGHGGGYKRMGTFIEFSKNFIDYLNAYHSKARGLRVNTFTKTTDSLHYYDSILVIEKRKREAPIHETSGTMSIDLGITNQNLSILFRIKRRVYRLTRKYLNSLLGFFRLPSF